MTDLAASFVELLRVGFRPGSHQGSCQFHIEGPDPQPFYLTLGQEGLDFEHGEHPDPEAVIKMPEATLSRIVSQPHLWDPRNPEMVAQVEMQGDLEIVAFLSGLAKKPSAKIAAIFRETELAAEESGPALTEVERLEAPDEDTVLEALREGRPIVATGSLGHHDSWSWGFDDLKEKFGHLELRKRAEGKSGETVGEFIEKLESQGEDDQEIYTEGIQLPPELWDYFEMPFFMPNAFNEPQIWMGSKAGERPCTDLHRDSSHGFLGQLAGRKKLILYSPDQAQNLYPVANYNTYQPCHARPWAPDYETYPLFEKTRPVEVVLEPGELLINPVGWFHCVYALDPVLSVSRFMNWQVWEAFLR